LIIIINEIIKKYKIQFFLHCWLIIYPCQTIRINIILLRILWIRVKLQQRNWLITKQANYISCSCKADRSAGIVRRNTGCDLRYRACDIVWYRTSLASINWSNSERAELIYRGADRLLKLVNKWPIGYRRLSSKIIARDLRMSRMYETTHACVNRRYSYFSLFCR